MRRRAAPVKRTDTFTADLIREALDTIEPSTHGDVERHALHQQLGRLAKGKYRRRNSPQYRIVEQTLAAMEKAGEVTSRYAPSQYDQPERKFGHTFFRLVRS